MFGIDAGFPSGFFGPAFSNPTLTTTFELVTLLETEVLDILMVFFLVSRGFNFSIGANIVHITILVFNFIEAKLSQKTSIERPGLMVPNSGFSGLWLQFD